MYVYDGWTGNQRKLYHSTGCAGGGCDTDALPFVWLERNAQWRRRRRTLSGAEIKFYKETLRQKETAQ